MTWLSHSALATVFFTGLILATQRLVSTGIPPAVFNFWFFLCAAFGFLALAVLRGQEFFVPKSTIPSFLVLVVMALGYNDFLVRAYASAPNPGYVRGVLSVSMIAVTLIAVILFNAHLSGAKMTGMLFILFGIVILCVSR